MRLFGSRDERFACFVHCRGPDGELNLSESDDCMIVVRVIRALLIIM